MSFLTTFHFQDATWWRKTGVDSFGKTTFASPVALKVRWEDRSQLVRKADGSEVTSRSRVFLDREITEGDYLFKGTSVASDPKSVFRAYEVLEFRSIPGLDASLIEYKAMV